MKMVPLHPKTDRNYSTVGLSISSQCCNPISGEMLTGPGVEVKHHCTYKSIPSNFLLIILTCVVGHHLGIIAFHIVGGGIGMAVWQVPPPPPQCFFHHCIYIYIYNYIYNYVFFTQTVYTRNLL